MADTLGSAEVEQTLALARQAVERRIADYRLAVFALLWLVASALAVVQRGDPGAMIAPAVGGFTALYAWVVRHQVRRRAIGERFVLATLGLDLLGITLLFASAPVSAIQRDNQVHFVAPTFLLFLLVNALRNDARSALLGGLLAALLIPLVLLRLERTPLLLAFSLAGLLVAGIGVSAANQARRNLDLFARLQLLRRYLAPQAVERVLRANADAALSLEGEALSVTIMSTDLRDFTAFAEKLRPEQVLRQLNAYHGAMLTEVRSRGGVLDKFIGDGALVLFGLPDGANPRPEDSGAAQAVACARAMLARLATHNAERAARGEAALRMGIGIHTGPVVAGNLGAPGHRLEFTVIGDAVNTASRLEGLTKEAGTPLLISAETAALLVNRAGLAELPPMRAKGKETLLRVYGLAESAVAAGVA